MTGGLTGPLPTDGSRIRFRTVRGPLSYLHFSVEEGKRMLNRSLSCFAAVLLMTGIRVYAGDVASAAGAVLGVTRDAAGQPLGRVQVTLHFTTQKTIPTARPSAAPMARSFSAI